MRDDYGPNRLSFRLAFRPFVDAFQFHGRSTRTEVVSFWLLDAIVTAFRMSIDDPSLAVRIAGGIWTLVWTWPWIPLFVRRLHDQGRTGRWILLNGVVLLAVATDIWIAPTGDGPSVSLDWWFFRASRQIAWTPLTAATTVVMVMTVLTLWVLFLLPGTPGTNRYGPNPRLAAAPPLIPAET